MHSDRDHLHRVQMIVCSVILLIPPTGASCLHLAETCAQWALAVERARAAVLARPGCRCPRSCAFGSSSQPLQHGTLLQLTNAWGWGVGGRSNSTSTPPHLQPTTNNGSDDGIADGHGAPEREGADAGRIRPNATLCNSNCIVFAKS